ncbi:MAG: PVC-type heme-binding CxxCH protein [Planctomycetota bacterium]
MNKVPGKSDFRRRPSYRRLPCHYFIACLLLHTASALFLGTSASAAQPPKFKLRPGDRIAIVGNGLADRMQHDGWIETYLQARYPNHQLVVRNLGFTGDELTMRSRSAGFGSPEDWLKRTEANVVFAFFGYNESFQGTSGIDKFKADLRKFVRDTHAPKTSAAGRRVVLFSPTAYEDLSDPLLPATDQLNEQLLTYTRAMAAVADELDVPFVDLYRPSLAAMHTASRPLTINGIHFRPDGNRELGRLIDESLFSAAEARLDAELEAIRDAVRQKNFYWFQRYRTTDGYSIFGGRKGTGGSKWTPNNEKVMQREMEVLDVMTANRDALIWAIAKGEQFEIDDSNAPPLIPVATNRPGPFGDGSYPFLGGEEAIERMTLPEGMAVNLFASEENFPELQNPVQAAVDTKGRLWVAAWPSYPHWKPTDEMNDKLLIFEDEDDDGQADRCKVFADGLHNPTGFEFYDGGVYVAQIPDIWFFKDTDGDDVADVRTRVLGGIDSADTHHSVNSFVVGPGGGIYFQEGLFHRSQIETPHGPPVRIKDAGVFRYDPRSQQLAPYANYGFANPHGHVFTYWGDDIIHDGTSAVPMYGPAISSRTTYPHKQRGAPPVYSKRTRPCAATAILSSSHFPESNRDNLLVCNVIGEQGVLQYEIREDGAGLKGIETEPLIMSTDPNFRPVDLEVGADGSVFVLDWQNPLIGHLQHNLRDSNRDRLHGRVYRIHCTDRKLVTAPTIFGAPVDELFRLLTHRDNAIRYRVRIELSGRNPSDVVRECAAWIETLDAQSSDHEHHLLEALWIYQHNHVVNEPLLRRLLSSNDYNVRAAAGHVLRAWREEVSDSQRLTAQLVEDDHPKPRLAGVLICSDVDSANAAQLALSTANQQPDKFLDFVLTETTRTLAPLWKQALAAGEPFCDDNPAAMNYLRKCASPQELAKLLKSATLLQSLAMQPNISANIRQRALEEIAKRRDSKPLDVLLGIIDQSGDSSASAIGELVDLFGRFDVQTLRTAKDRLTVLATESPHDTVRQAALASVVRIDGNPQGAWALASGTASGVIDVLSSVQRIPEKQTRSKFYKWVRPLAIDAHSAKLFDETSSELSKVQASAIDALAHVPGNHQQKLDDLLTLLEQHRYRSTVTRTLRSIPSAARNTGAASRIVAATSSHLATLSASERAADDAARELQLALEFAGLLPVDERDAAIEKLKSFSVRILKLATIPHRMAYDQQKLVVQAGEPLRLLFENEDNMPHNVVLVKPGELSKVGIRAEQEATLPSAVARQYVPKLRQVLMSSDLLQPGSRQSIDFSAPKTPGMYPYVCTYPGHWRRMFGTLIVVKDIDQYNADPAGYLASNSIKPRDELLKFNRPLRNWKYEELRPSLDRVASDRNFNRGTALFQAASCGSCHSVPDGQKRFAPDLTKLDAKRTTENILRSIIEPSHTIDAKYRMSKLLLDSGKVVVGLVVEETDAEVILIIDPLVSCEPTIVAKDEIEERYESDVSLMPAGLLDRFTEEEILELCAFVVSRGDKTHSVYRDGDSVN